MERFYRKLSLSISQQELYDWHASGAAFERLVPPWERIEIMDWQGGELTRSLSTEQQFGDISKGARIRLRTKVGIFWQKLVAEHVNHQEPHMFVDEMRKGPFSHWHHEHRFLDDGVGRSILEDEIHYRLPFSAISSVFAGSFVRKKLERMFSFRHLRTKRDLEQKKKYCSEKLRIAVTGSSGLVGSSLCAFLRCMGHDIYRVSRKKQLHSADQISLFEPSGWEGLDAVIHLAGESIAARWSAKKKRKIRDSRVQMTSQIADLLSKLKNPPRVLISASAVGFYGHRDHEECSEETPIGSGFLADICRDWEAAVAPARAQGIRCVHPRIGVVLTPKGGALQQMLLPFRLGVGGPVGSGKQWMSWISIDDLIYLLYFCIQNPDIHGAINATAPNPVQNAEFGRSLGRILRRPAIVPLPSFMVRTIFGEMGQALLLEGAKVLPRKAQQGGYCFVHPVLEEYFKEVL